MPIINISSGTWWGDEPAENKDNRLSPTREFHKQITIKRTNTEFDCIICKKKRGKGFRYIGGHWARVCHHCFGQWAKNSEEVIKGILTNIRMINPTLKENKKKWDRDALVGALMMKEETNN